MTKVAIMGYGVVGKGLIELIDKNREKKKADIVISSILVRNKDKYVNLSHYDVITNDAKEFFAADSEIVIELMGGVDAAYEYVKRALEAKKHVITANKDLIATHGEELFNIAINNNVALKFEAAVGGGIPIIKPLTETLAGNDITSIKAIINGTTNFILTKMGNENLSYDVALKEAQDLGFAEANPDADVLGLDPCRKIAILSTLAFGQKVDWNKIQAEGITKLDQVDLALAEKFNCKIKLIAESVKTSKGVYASVKPALVDKNSLLAKVDNEVNCVVLNGDETGELLFIGKGAGKSPTGTSVYGDLDDIINGRFTKIDHFNNPEADLVHYSCKTCNGVVRVTTDSKELVKERARATFNNMKVLTEGYEDEVVIYIECTSEAYINKFIDDLKVNNSYIDHKVLIIQN